MTLRTLEASGPDYLDLVTSLLQRARLASPVDGPWEASDLEAADLQWWWRRDQHRDPSRQRFWLEGDSPVGAFVFTDWGARLSCDLISADYDVCPVVEVLWPAALEIIESTAGKPIELSIRDDDVQLVEVARQAGFAEMGEVTVSTWMQSPKRPEVGQLPGGFALVARSDRMSEPHHMIARNGADIAERLAECTLYRADLDLSVLSPAGDLAAYSLFWADPVTRVGLVEPMRTEQAFQRMGLGRHLISAGLERLAALGCSRVKVCYVQNNEAARRLYLGSGFSPRFRSCAYRREC
ncbi:MAG: GNAT family N-acetyltransferase [Acidimicrobiales bacterium]